MVYIYLMRQGPLFIPSHASTRIMTTTLKSVIRFMFTTPDNMTTPRYIKAAAIIAAWVYVIAETLIKMTYAAGYELGKAVHNRNDQLARISRSLIEVDVQELVIQTAKQSASKVITHTIKLAKQFLMETPAPTASSTHIDRVYEIASDLRSFTVKELRQLTGVKNTKLRKDQLIGMALAMV